MKKNDKNHFLVTVLVHSIFKQEIRVYTEPHIPTSAGFLHPSQYGKSQAQLISSGIIFVSTNFKRHLQTCITTIYFNTH